jgi:protein gp37
MGKTKIDWCDYTWNPVWGCLNKCEYCYARKINHRYKYINKDFKPTWIEKNYQKKYRKDKPVRIFVNSMSDIAFWEKEWMEKVLSKIKTCPQHEYIFLTKEPVIYEKYRFPENCLLGTTITNNLDMYNKTTGKMFVKNKNRFLSIEPIHENIELLSYIEYYKWVIIGAETGNSKSKILPESEWIERIVRYCQACDIPVFLKDNIEEYYDGRMLREYAKKEMEQ